MPILRWSTSFDALSVEDDLALRESDGTSRARAPQMVLDQWLWDEIRAGYLKGR